MVSECCFTGYFHKGTPKGSFTQLGADARKTYVTGADAAQTSGAVLVIPDVFGVSLNNIQVIADYYAERAGARVYVPDFFNGKDAYTLLDGVPMESEEAKKRFNVPDFLAANPPRDASFPMFEAAARAVREEVKGKKLAVVGFCWGAPGAMRLGSNDAPADAQADAVAWAHPSVLDLPSDMAKLTKPACFVGCEVDTQLPKEKREIVEEEMIKLAKKGIYTTFRFFPGVTHGWSVRGDQQNEFTARAARDAQQTLADFFSVEFRGRSA